MGFIARWRQRRAEANFTKRVQSADWFKAEDAIKRLPGPLAAAKALEIAVRLSKGQSNTAVMVVGLNLGAGETPSVTTEFNTGTHYRSSIDALGRIADPAASRRLLQIVAEMPGFADEALRALASPAHAPCAADLFAQAQTWTGAGQRSAMNALWKMETEEAFELCFRLHLLQDPKSLEGIRLRAAASNEAYREQLHNAWREQALERLHPRAVQPTYSKPLPLP